VPITSADNANWSDPSHGHLPAVNCVLAMAITLTHNVVINILLDYINPATNGVLDFVPASFRCKTNCVICDYSPKEGLIN
jgi:broad specificity phosphatase PhoE